MPWIPTDKEIASLLSSAGPSRYEYFVKRVADTERIVGLRNQEGWVLFGDVLGGGAFPMWPHARFAQLRATGDWADCETTEIDLRDWLEEWSSKMAQDRVEIAVFPTPAGKGSVVPVPQLREDLKTELEKY